ncbi:AzlC family ABC transporter permease [Mangrovibrevibacter kandeliae]|uniref:AzlC family ABC transporter permease n=1 Tax=Mangrovibrevibacter kandeliae TaxID=2968473 RepID=UPI002119A845|nr:MULTISPECIES: AzlC family ABC transporter permease [unclassified Aurantimonas]MCQ8782558.1 AzlC family ABC transporter permease [Aurantimonas sp. CSK15Z-1]MCW4114633.1 AzlC family ABC transporter permease [Aurantimonas sp. MSK8Z-1]
MTQTVSDADEAAADLPARHWALLGIKGIVSTPALILTTSFLGFAALARDAGVGLPETAFMTFVVWALPAKIILVGAITAGLSLPAAAIAVALSSLRLMPMVTALMPEIRGPRTPTRTLLFLSHFVAVTGWVFAMERVKNVPRRHRPLFFGCFAVTLTCLNTLLVALVYNLMGQLPALATGALAFLTPVYFLTSLFGTARELSGRLALLTGMLCLPLAHWLNPEFDLLIAGLAGGVMAHLAGRAIDRRKVA